MTSQDAINHLRYLLHIREHQEGIYAARIGNPDVKPDDAQQAIKALPGIRMDIITFRRAIEALAKAGP